MIKKYLISPPFGNWISNQNATRVMGSYTLEPRKGLLKQAIKTIRFKDKGIVNAIGLRNKGIRNVTFKNDRIYSIAAINDGDWERFLEIIPFGAMVELNLGCPNSSRIEIDKRLVKICRDKFPICSIKVSPTEEGYKEALTFGGLIHMANSMPCSEGGYSGPENKPIVIEYVRKLANRDLKVIAGGGIRTKQDIWDYSNAGALYFSLSTSWLRPFRTMNIIA